ncbi:hypothetical protein TNCV_4035441 [Trichonephila clavipes]|nr:hypothetical protein TNCV_4035441 [Trichonephila clavipes]
MPSCHSVHDLELAVQDLRAHLPQDNIRCLINSMPDRVAACIAACIVFREQVSQAKQLQIHWLKKANVSYWFTQRTLMELYSKTKLETRSPASVHHDIGWCSL